MKIFIDTAKLDEIKEVCAWGIVDGVTTNPSLIKKAIQGLGEKTDMEIYIKKILETAGNKRSVSLEVIGLTEEEMFSQAKKLYEKFNSVANNVAIKIPINPCIDIPSSQIYDGLKVTRRLSGEGIPVNSTLVMTPEQALLAAKAGARYISPFAGRIDDYLRNRIGMKFGKGDYFPAHGLRKRGKIIENNGIVSGVDLVEKIVKIFKNYEFKTEIIAASLRNPCQVREVALVGAHIATIPFGVLQEMMLHEKTSQGVKKFSEDVIPGYSKLFD